MKYIELVKGLFTAEHEARAKQTDPYVAYSMEANKLMFNLIPEENQINYFYIESLEDNNVITLDSTTWAGYGDNKSKLEYSNDTNSWTSMTGVDSITVNKGEKLYMRCIEGNICKDISSISEDEVDIIMLTPLFKTTNNCNIGGNINTAMFDYTYKTEDCILPIIAFAGLFMGIDIMAETSANYIIDASKLELPATVLADYCYSYMFYYCTSLTTAPKILPATTLATECYYCMFYGCSAITAVPYLPATSLTTDCYSGMFNGCTSLTTAPELPATTLADGCYYNMFGNCTSLTTAPELPASELVEGCYSYMFEGCTSLTTSPELSATKLAKSCYHRMFCECTSLTTAPELPATSLVEGCYHSMFEYCTSLTVVPELPATILAKYCYCNMFWGCTKLSYIKCLATDILADGCTTSWVTIVTSPGTFIKHPNMTSWASGNNGIPEGWTVVDAEL